MADPFNPTRVYAAVAGNFDRNGDGKNNDAIPWEDKGIWRSDDGGNTWIHIDAGITFPEDTDGVDNDGKDGPDEVGEGIRLEQRIKLTASPTVPGLMYAGFISAIGQLNGLFQSTDGSRSWVSLSVDLRITEMYCVGYDPLNHIIFSGTQDNGVAAQTQDRGFT